MVQAPYKFAGGNRGEYEPGDDAADDHLADQAVVLAS